MSDGDLKLGVFEHEAFFRLLEGRRTARQGGQSTSLKGGSGGRPKPPSKPAARPTPVSNEKRIAKLLRVAAKAPEVMVKVTGTDSSLKQVKAHLVYLGREDDAEGELNDGQQLYGKAAIGDAAELFRDEAAEVAGKKMAVHVMFSMPEGTATGEQVLDATRATAERIFEGHEYVMVLHEDKPHKHVHVVIAARSNEGKQLRHYKPQLQAWRDQFATELRERGVLAEATPRVVRGVVQKSVSRPIRAIRDERAKARRDGTPIRPPARTDVAKALEVANGERPVEAPWEKVVRENRAVVDRAWQQLAKDLEKVDGDQRGVRLVKGFSENMPPARFERDRLRELADEGITSRDRGYER
jgi:hypothetical protein